MNEELIQKKKALEIMQFKFNIQKLEVRLLEIDEEKVKLQETIDEQRLKLKEMEEGE